MNGKVALCTPENGLHCVQLFVTGPHSEREIHACCTISLADIVCVWPTVAINRVTRPFEKLSRRSRSRRATKTPWDHDLCPNFQRKVTAATSSHIHPSTERDEHVHRLFTPCVYCFDFLCGIARCTPRARFQDGLFKLESESEHTHAADTGNQGKWSRPRSNSKKVATRENWWCGVFVVENTFLKSNSWKSLNRNVGTKTF
jgi:hypothetical protein